MSITDHNMGGKYKTQAFKRKALALILVTGCLCALPICIAFWLHHIRRPSLNPLILGLLLLKVLFFLNKNQKTHQTRTLEDPTHHRQGGFGPDPCIRCPWAGSLAYPAEFSYCWCWPAHLRRERPVKKSPKLPGQRLRAFGAMFPAQKYSLSVLLGRGPVSSSAWS